MDGDARRDAGETLAEVLVAVSILGIAVAALLGGIGASATGSDVHRKQAAGEVALRAYAEAVENATFNAGGCSAATTSYRAAAVAAYTAPTGYTLSNPIVVTNQAPSSSCTTLQLVKLDVVTTRTTLTVYIVKAAP
jgi:type II secretory pathway pseudopilin PulG